MLTDAPPRKANRAGFLESDQTRTLDLPQDGSLLTITKSIESAMRRGRSTDVRRTCAEFLDAASEFYKVPACGLRVLAARPLRVRERWTTELFGDYTSETMLIRVWMRTAVRKEVTSFGTFLSTLCHEFCHQSRLSEVRVSRFVALPWLLRKGRRALSLCERDDAQETFLGGHDRRALAD